MFLRKAIFLIMFRQKLRISFTACIVICVMVTSAQAASIRDSVVKIFVTSNRMDYYRPWQSRGSSGTSGSGCIISGNLILTNAHVVSDSTFIQVRRESNPKKFTAKLKAIGHDCDLALLTVDDPEFFKGVAPLGFGELPNLQDNVSVIGFPRGGDKLSITEGVVSRVEIIPYTQSSKHLLGVQIDAAINPGNSGGPVFKNGNIVGIAMQIISDSQNIGYMIPTPIINHFLKDLEDGTYNGFPTLGIKFDKTESKSLRKYYKIPDDVGGVLIENVLPFSPAYGILKHGDIIIEINGIPVGVDATFEFRQNERLLFSHLINDSHIGETIETKIIRDGKFATKQVKLHRFVGLIPYPHHFEKPPYYIQGGLIFTVLSVDLLQAFGGQWWEKAPMNFLHYLIGKGRLNKENKKEIVVLLDVLPDDINIGYHNFGNDIMETVNGQKFLSFKEFVALVENNKEEYLIFETDQNEKIIINPHNISSITNQILLRNNITARYSDDVAEWILD